MSNFFRTVLEPKPSSFQINHQSGVLCIGSCFAENMGTRLEDFKFQTYLNPFGIIYNPISISKSLEILLDEKSFFIESDLFENLGRWHSFQHHGSFSFPKKEMTLEKINSSLETTRFFLKEAEYLILTLGTSNVFIDKISDVLVANCHKVPQKSFYKKTLSVEEIIQSLGSIIEHLNSSFPRIKVITTVSPVRHIRDGLIENQVSKSKLIIALNTLTQQYSHVKYFPAYELLLDDLRDYRFFKKDMIHPNEIAVDYIWDFFSKTFFDPKTIELNSKIEKLKIAARHKPFHPQSEEHQRFVKKQINKMDNLEREFPFLDFGKEKKQLRTSNT